METIDCLNLIEDPSLLNNYLKDGMRIRNLSNSSLNFELNGGVVRLRGDWGNCRPWLAMMDHPSIHTLELRNLNDEFLRSIPDNVQKLTFDDFFQLKQVGTLA